MSFAVGQEVRCMQEHPVLGRFSSRGHTVATANGDGTFDLIASAEGLADESSVPSDRLAPLEPFEEGEKPAAGALDLKERGNALFKRCDYVVAMAYYSRSLAGITQLLRLSVGSEVLVRRCDGSGFAGAMVSDVSGDATTCDVIFDSDEEEERVSVTDRVVLVPPPGLLVQGTGACELQTALYLNLAKCSSKLRRLGWAVRYSSLAVAALQRCIEGGDEGASKRLADALGVRARSLLQCGRPQLAGRDADLLSLLPAEAQRARALRAEVDRYRQRRQREDRRLARDVAQWVDAAMRRSEELRAGEELPPEEEPPEEEPEEEPEGGNKCSVC